ncbi:MAG: DMT family transporter [Verrucomicrobia bacterium]|nr:DMT family transporter [Verrucomicrobiota bacterium]
MKSWLLLFACNLMWALQFTCIKLVEDQVGPWFTVFGPMFLATALLYPLVRAERTAPVAAPTAGRSRWADVRLYGLLVIAGVFPGQVLLTYGTRWTLASNAAVLTLTLPVCTAFMAFVFLRERMSAVRWLSFAMAIAGVVMCSGSDLRGASFGLTNLAGNLLIFSGILGSAFYNSYGKTALRIHSPLRMCFYTYLGMLVLMLPFVLGQEADVFARIPQFTARTWAGLALLTFFHNFLSMVLFLKALKVLDAIQATLSNYLITAFGVPIAAIWLGERLTPLAIAGGVLVFASTLVITVWEDLRREPATPG